ncbi:divalent-cation tolerance protein CutA [Ferrimonas balearica]|uniref:divalent-cation tolerance protein CutA n=1 Tax=Ferrimonas balearica TaxID=44012 RepID=UPI001C9A177D|nr:divalent-cation tolerance protein CutA [Ferrimonas balearica]MBY5992261.1 divalent-cation tolerance protein CutA [Ferrimonas balearica]
MSEHPLVVLCTCPDNDSAERLAQRLLADRLVACANLIPGVTSLYHWQGELCRDTEVQLLLKTQADCLPRLEATLREAHPYDVPEMIALPIEWGHQPYLDWMKLHCQP